MFACDSAATARASRSKRCRSALGASVFTATRRPSSRSSASQTALIAPRPSGSSRRYRPATSSSLIGPDYRDRRARPPDDRRSAGARARARAAAARRGGRRRRRGGPGSRRRRGRARRPAAVPELGDGRLRRPRGRHAGAARGRGSVGGRTPGERAGSQRARRSRSRPARSFPTAPTRSCRSSGRGATATSVEVERVEPGENVRPRGGDAAAGDTVVPAGTTCGPAQLGALAAAGLDAVRVRAPPARRRARDRQRASPPRRAARPRRDLRVEHGDARRAAASVRAPTPTCTVPSPTTRTRRARRSSAGSRRMC